MKEHKLSNNKELFNCCYTNFYFRAIISTSQFHPLIMLRLDMKTHREFHFSNDWQQVPQKEVVSV